MSKNHATAHNIFGIHTLSFMQVDLDLYMRSITDTKDFITKTDLMCQRPMYIPQFKKKNLDRAIHINKTRDGT